MGTTVYDRLLREVRPEVIETEERYAEVSARLAELVRKGTRRTVSETRLLRLLAVLVEDYDRRHAMPPDDGTPAERLRYLLEASGRTATALIPVFGQRSHANEALNGKRPISLEQARKLGALFGVKPGLFV
ncbi:MAG: transcriptional regulator [Bryobacterales bacterium]|nr:transcriptional regulator [Bryobacterales bacterium]